MINTIHDHSCIIIAKEREHWLTHMKNDIDFSLFFKALGDNTRQRIINLLLWYPAIHVNDLSHILAVPQSKISRHLAVLRTSGWLVFNRREKWIYYKLNPELDPVLLEALKNLFHNHLQFESDLTNARSVLSL
ncbi:MAG: hypothetical protein Kow0042_08300 [Calditrichia bacterium]